MTSITQGSIQQINSTTFSLPSGHYYINFLAYNYLQSTTSACFIKFLLNGAEVASAYSRMEPHSTTYPLTAIINVVDRSLLQVKIICYYPEGSFISLSSARISIIELPYNS